MIRWRECHLSTEGRAFPAEPSASTGARCPGRRLCSGQTAGGPVRGAQPEPGSPHDGGERGGDQGSCEGPCRSRTYVHSPC